MDDDVARMLELGPVRVADAQEFGVGRGRLRQVGVAHPYPGMAALGGHDRVDSLAARLDRHQFLSHATAARIWGIALPLRLRDAPLDVSTMVPHNAPRIAGVRGHRLDEHRVELALAGGVRVTTPAETWRHLSTLLTVEELVAAGDSLLRRRRPLATPAELTRALRRHRAMRGVRRLRVAHDAVRTGTDSAAETRLRLLIVRAGLPEPLVNPPVELPEYGRAFADLAYPEHRVAIEYDGAHHRTDSRQFERDILRLEAFAAAGWRVVRVTSAQLAGPDRVITRIRAALARE